jgi:peptidoglycan hydrolase CwlO-like protein
MGTRHWPEDADEEVERLEAENRDLEKSLNTWNKQVLHLTEVVTKLEAENIQLKEECGRTKTWTYFQELERKAKEYDEAPKCWDCNRPYCKGHY